MSAYRWMVGLFLVGLLSSDRAMGQNTLVNSGPQVMPNVVATVPQTIAPTPSSGTPIVLPSGTYMITTAPVTTPTVASEAIDRNTRKAEKSATWKAWASEHRREPDGCPTPIGCGNLYSEFKFIFGSCRQFFGTGEATVGHCKRTTIP